MTYFTAVVDEKGKVTTFADIYGLDKKIGTALLGKSVSFPAPADNPEADAQANAPAPVRCTAASNDIVGSMQGLFGD